MQGLMIELAILAIVLIVVFFVLGKFPALPHPIGLIIQIAAVVIAAVWLINILSGYGGRGRLLFLLDALPKLA